MFCDGNFFYNYSIKEIGRIELIWRAQVYCFRLCVKVLNNVYVRKYRYFWKKKTICSKSNGSSFGYISSVVFLRYKKQC